jgi:hypothetical protein
MGVGLISLVSPVLAEGGTQIGWGEGVGLICSPNAHTRKRGNDTHIVPVLPERSRGLALSE